MCKDDILGPARRRDVDCCRIPREHASRHYSAGREKETVVRPRPRPAIASQQFQGKLISADATAAMKQLHSKREERDREGARYSDYDVQDCQASSMHLSAIVNT